MKLSNITKKRCTELVSEMMLPDVFNNIIYNTYIPLIEIILARKQSQPLLISINGAQGAGKTTLTTFIKLIIESELNYPTAILALDDFYYSRADRIQLSESVHPLFITRGVPGTHDINWLEDVVSALKNHTSIIAPRFNKALDDRTHESGWTHYNNDIEVILFEGWCNHSPYQSKNELLLPVNDLEKNMDQEGIWRNHANEQLKQYHQRLFNQTDISIMLKAPDFNHVYEWRNLQEKKLGDNITNTSQLHIMNEKEINNFIQHYERISRHTIEYLPDKADIIIPIAPDHSFQDIIVNHHK